MADPTPRLDTGRTARARRGADAVRRRAARPAVGGQRGPHRVDRPAPDVLLARRSGSTCATRRRSMRHLLGRRRRDVDRAARPVRLPGLVLARDGRPRPDRRRQRQGHARPDPHRPVAGRHGADDRLVRRLDDDPRRRRQLVRACRPRSACSRSGRSCTARATRTRSPTAGCSGRSWAPAAATSAGTPASASATPTGEHIELPTIIAQADGRDYSDIDVDPARRRALPGRRPRAPDPPERLVALGRRGPDLVTDPADAVPRLEHQAVPAPLGRDRLRLPRRGPRPARRQPERQPRWRRHVVARRPAVRGRPRRAARARQRVRLPGHRDLRVGRARRRPPRLPGRPTAPGSTGSACGTGPDRSIACPAAAQIGTAAVHLAVGVEVRPQGHLDVRGAVELAARRSSRPAAASGSRDRRTPSASGSSTGVASLREHGDVGRATDAQRAQLRPAEDRGRARGRRGDDRLAATCPARGSATSSSAGRRPGCSIE